MTRVMPHRTPEQSVYLHLFSASDGLITRMRYADLVRQCHLSLSAVQRASQRCRYRKPLGWSGTERECLTSDKYRQTVDTVVMW